MKSSMRGGLVLLAILASLPASLRGETGVSAGEIVIGSCSDIEGPSKRGLPQLEAAKTYLQYVNENGGVHGRKIKVVAHDDSYDGEKAIACFKQLQAANVFAGAFFVGSPTAAKYVQMAETAKLPILGFNAGAQFIYEPVKRYVVAVRGSNQDQINAMVGKLWSEAGARKFGVLYASDPFGVANLESARIALKKFGAEPVVVASFSMPEFQKNAWDLDRLMGPIIAAKPEVLIMGMIGAPAAGIVKYSRQRGFKPVFASVSNDPTLIKDGGADAEGFLVFQAVPSPSRKDLPSVALYHKLLAKYAPKASPSFVGLEGFIDAMILVEGLKRAGPALTREKFLDAVESIQNFDMGLGSAFKVNYGAKDHKAFEQIEPTSVRGGKFEPFTAWASLKK